MGIDYSPAFGREGALLNSHPKAQRDRLGDVYVFSPYWFVNWSGLPLLYGCGGGHRSTELHGGQIRVYTQERSICHPLLPPANKA